MLVFSTGRQNPPVSPAASFTPTYTSTRFPAIRMAISRFLNDLLGFRPRQLQVAALCLRGESPNLEVLLVTSRSTKKHPPRWILPKGWPIVGTDLAGSARQEAWEEAGVRGRLNTDPVGSYLHEYLQDGHLVRQVEVRVFRLDQATLADDYPEAGQRKRCWWSLEDAAAAVEQPGLAELLRRLARTQRRPLTSETR